MSLDICLIENDQTVFDANITHNLTKMAFEADIYDTLWYSGGKKAIEIVGQLYKGLERLKTNPEYYKKFDSPNGWGVYDNFVPFVEKVMNACLNHPFAEIEVSR